MAALPRVIAVACRRCQASIEVPLNLGPTTSTSAVLDLDLSALRDHYRTHNEDQEQQMDTTPDAPKVGNIVHYRSYGTPGGEYPSECRDALVIEVPDTAKTTPYGGCPNGTGGFWEADLAIFTPTGVFFNTRCQSGDEGGAWHWPEGEASGSPAVYLELIGDADRLHASVALLAKFVSRAAR